MLNNPNISNHADLGNWLVEPARKIVNCCDTSPQETPEQADNNGNKPTFNRKEPEMELRRDDNCENIDHHNHNNVHSHSRWTDDQFNSANKLASIKHPLIIVPSEEVSGSGRTRHFDDRNNVNRQNEAENFDFDDKYSTVLGDFQNQYQQTDSLRGTHRRQAKARSLIINTKCTFVVCLLTSWLTLSPLIVTSVASPADIALSHHRASHRISLNSTSMLLFESPPSSVSSSVSSSSQLDPAATINLFNNNSRTSQQQTKHSQHSSSLPEESLLLSVSQIKLSSLDDLLHEQTLEDAIQKLTLTWQQFHGTTENDEANATNDRMISSQVKLETSHQSTTQDNNIPTDTTTNKIHYRLHRRSTQSEQISTTADSKVSENKASKEKDEATMMAKDDSWVYQYQTINAHKTGKSENPRNSQAESIVRSLNEQHAARSGNKPPIKLTLNCSRCMANEEARIMQIETIKFNILSKLGMNHVPNISRDALPQIPHISHLLNRSPSMLSDDPRSYDTKKSSFGFANEYFGPNNRENDDGGDEFFINPERSIVFSQKPPADRTVPDLRTEYFKFPSNIVNSHVRRAHLWLYLKPSKSNRIDEESTGVIVIYQVVRPEYEGAPTRALARKKKVTEQTLRKGGWIQVDIKILVSKWFQHPDSNLGISIDSYDSDGVPLTILHHDDASLNTALRPFVEVRVTSSPHGNRKRRASEMTCEDQSAEVQCCRYPLTVDFDQFGWDWVIAPKRYVANYCSGECPVMTMPNYPHTHIIQQASQNSRRPCCSPRRMTSISMLYMDGEKNIIYGLVPNMVVDRCGCS